MNDMIQILAQELQQKTEYVENVVRLLDEGNTIPFIARYRKELHGAMDDTTLRTLETRLQYLRGLQERRETVLSAIEGQGKLTEELRAAIDAAGTLSELEDLYRPYKQKRRTRATVAREKGLEPLAQLLFRQGRDCPVPEDAAADYVDAEKGVETVEDALAGASDIIAEWVSDDAALRKTVEQFNRLCRVVTQIGDYRKLPNPPITGYEFHVIQLVSQVCPHDLILPYLEETLEELKTREPEPSFPFRARVAVVGSEIDDPDFTKLIESCGAMVVADRYCFGSFPGREEIEIFPGESAFDAVCRHYLHWNQCARFMDGMKIDQRHSEVKRLAEEFKADGLIYENMKFCEFWSYEKVLASNIFINELHIPTCTIEKEYALGAVGQLRTRFQAFIESLEIKNIQGGK